MIMKFILGLLALLTFSLKAQELQATVTVQYENLPVINKESLVNFAQTVQDYLNSNRFSGATWNNPKIKCTFTIFFLSAADETSYLAQVFVGSQRPVYNSTKNSPMLTILDNNWSFNYEKNQALYFNPLVNNSITSFLDYYAFLILGMDNDSWEQMSGTPFFSKALDIVYISLSSKNSKGWDKSSGTYNRRDVVEDILNERYRPFREAISEYHYGIDLFEVNKNNGQKKIVSLINVLQALKSKIDLRSIFIKVFFDAKYQEIIEYLKDYPDKSIFKSLKEIDPPHAGKYDEIIYQ